MAICGPTRRGLASKASAMVTAPTKRPIFTSRTRIEDAADELRKRVLRNDFDALAIVAPPKALGVIKPHLHKEVTKRIVCTINKEMSGRPTAEIEALLANELRAPLPAL